MVKNAATVIAVPGAATERVQWSVARRDKPNTAVALFKLFGEDEAYALVHEFDNGWIMDAKDLDRLISEVDIVADELVDFVCALRALRVPQQMEMFSEEELVL
jgi:hypothetical protein